MCSQECQVQGMPQDWALLQGMPVQEEDQESNLAQAVPQNENDTHIDECGLVQPNPPLVGMLKLINHIGTTNGTQGNT